MENLLKELNLEHFIAPFKKYQIDFSTMQRISINEIGVKQFLRMDKSIEDILMKKCGADEKSIIMICSAVQTFN